MAVTSGKQARHPTDKFMQPVASIFFAPRGDGTRRRRGTDAGRLIGAVVATLILGLLLTSREEFQTTFTKILHPPVLGLSWLFTGLWFVSSVGTLLFVIVMALIGRRIDVLRDFAVAAVFAVGTCLLFQFVLGTTGNFPNSDPASLAGVNLGFPIPFLAVVAALTYVALPYFSRSLQRILEFMIVLAFFTGIADGAGLPFSLLGSIIVGWGAAAGVRLIFGSPTGLPASSDVLALVNSLNVSVKHLVPSKYQDWGLVRYDALSDDGKALSVSLYGRDAQQSQFFAKIFRAIFYKNDSAPFSFTRSQQVDHECYSTIVANTLAPKRTSYVVASGMVGPERDGLIVSQRPQGTSISTLIDEKGSISDTALESLCDIVHRFQGDAFAHESIDINRVYVDGDIGGIGDFDRARKYCDEDALNRDVAALITVMSMAVGPERSTAAALKVFGKDDFVQALGFLQSAALPSSLSVELRKDHHKGLLKATREAGASAAGVAPPKLAEMKRMSWTNLILAVGTLIGAWALIGVFFHVAQSFSTIKNANVVWVIITAIIAQCAYFGSALSTMGSVTNPLPYFPVVTLELSNCFSGLALGTPAVLAARIRFFQKHGVDTPIAVSSGVLTSTASWIVKGGLFLVSLPFALSEMHFTSPSSTSPSDSGTKILEYGIILIVGIGILVAILFAVPRWRKLVKDRLVPKFREVVSHFKTLIRQPMNMLEIFGGMLIAQIVIALALGSALHAFNHSLSLPIILVVLTLGSMLGGVSPVPGGMGVVEAGMILGLKAAGIPNDVAVSAVFIQRLFTAYLPPIAGWFALMWLRRKDYL